MTRTWTPKQIKEIENCALVGCYTKTIARITGIPEQTLRNNFGDLISLKRAERKFNLRNEQMKLVGAGNPTMLIFLGKNDLGQTDKHEVSGEFKITLASALAKLPEADKSNDP